MDIPLYYLIKIANDNVFLENSLLSHNGKGRSFLFPAKITDAKQKQKE